MAISISGAVEGITDRAALERLITYLNAEVHSIDVVGNNKQLLKRLVNYNYAAQFAHWVVLVDLDVNFACAVEAKTAWLAKPNALMCFRIVVRKLETWFLADRENIAHFLGVSIVLIPKNPEALDDPKLEMVNLARKSNKRTIKDKMIPREGSGRSEGIAYAATLIDFATNHWDIERAAGNSESLQRCINCLQRLTGDE